MNKIKLLCLALVVGLSFGCACPMCHSKATASAPVLRHVVMFQFTADTTPDQLQEIEAKREKATALERRLSKMAGQFCLNIQAQL